MDSISDALAPVVALTAQGLRVYPMELDELPSLELSPWDDWHVRRMKAPYFVVESTKGVICVISQVDKSDVHWIGGAELPM